MEVLWVSCRQTLRNVASNLVLLGHALQSYSHCWYCTLKLCALQTRFIFMGNFNLGITLVLRRQQVDCSAVVQPSETCPAISPLKTPLPWLPPPMLSLWLELTCILAMGHSRLLPCHYSCPITTQPAKQETTAQKQNANWQQQTITNLLLIANY